MHSDRFVNLKEALKSLSTDPATANDPIKRSFIFDGEKVTANVSILSDTGDAIHIRVGDEVRRVGAGDLIFIPQATVHGPIIDSGPIALLSIFAPFFDRNLKNIVWSRDGFV
ncbi:hypothetical protein [Ramlibacter sp. PS4R-6]|uniref:hypothetical protein n=1 Tax=Ramlibacter sp. PS4R-6 TaxID=3133438 RepID=UPI0030A4A190